MKKNSQKSGIRYVGTNRKLVIDDGYLQMMATAQSMAGASEMGGIMAVKECDDDFIVVGMWPSATSIDQGEHTISKTDLACAVSIHADDVEDPRWIRGIWHTHPYGHGWSAQDEMNIEYLLGEGTVLFELLFSNARNASARRDTMVNGIHISEPLKVTWSLCEELLTLWKQTEGVFRERLHTPIGYMPPRRSIWGDGHWGRALGFDDGDGPEPDGNREQDIQLIAGELGISGDDVVRIFTESELRDWIDAAREP